jgi:hypothetical protein
MMVKKKKISAFTAILKFFQKNPIMSWTISALIAIGTIGGAAWWIKGTLDDVSHSKEMILMEKERLKEREEYNDKLYELRMENIELNYKLLKNDSVK